MSVFILIKLVAAGMTMKILLKKWIPGLSEVMRVAFSLLYVFCAFNMQYYYAVMWLDVSCMFPLVMYGYFLLMKEKKRIPYIIFLSVTCMMSFQHTYMLILMLLILTGILPLLAKEKYTGNLLRLLTATLTAMMISAWIWLPGAVQILDSSRKEGSLSLMGIYHSVWIFYTAKWMKLLNLGIPLAFVSACAVKHYKEKFVGFFVTVIMALCIPIGVESTNMLWHGGSYMGYTMRFSYMIAFWVLIAGAYMYDVGYREKCHDGNRRGAACMVGALLVMAATMMQYLLLKEDTTVYKETVPAAMIILIVGVTWLGGRLLLNGRKEILEKCFLALVILQILSLAHVSVLISGEKGSTVSAMCNDVAKRERKSEPLSRLKNPDGRLSHNYPLIMRKNAASCYLAASSKRQLDGMSDLGYAHVGYRMSSYGGTIFSDALLGMNEAVSREAVNARLYQYQDHSGDYCFYQNIYKYKGRGVKIKNAQTLAVNREGNPFAVQNQIAAVLLGRELFDVAAGTGNEMDIAIGEESVLYFYAEHGEKIEEVIVTDSSNKETVTYALPASGWKNGILELGNWKDASLTIQVVAEEPLGKIFCAVLNLQDFLRYEPSYFDTFSVNGRSNALEIVLNGAEGDDSLFLPLYRDEGWKCTVNGFDTEIKEFAGFLMEIPLQKGRNEIELTFIPRGFMLGVCITLTGIVLLIAGFRYSVQKERETINKLLLVSDEAVFVGIIVMFYVLPLVFLFKELIRSVLQR